MFTHAEGQVLTSYLSSKPPGQLKAEGALSSGASAVAWQASCRGEVGSSACSRLDVAGRPSPWPEPEPAKHTGGLLVGLLCGLRGCCGELHTGLDAQDLAAVGQERSR